jgi:hypothetical protein
MLNERLDNLSSIGDKQSVLNVISCLLHGTTSFASLQQYLFSKVGIKTSETLHVVILLESMGLILVKEDELICTPQLSSDKPLEESFLRQYIGFLISEEVINLSVVEYDLLTDSYKLPSKSFKYRHAGYRNLLISFGVLILRRDRMYDISELLSQFLHRPGLVKKLSQKRLKEILVAEEKMGEIGEQFVLEYERKRLGLPLSPKIKQVSLIDVSSGFDIASFNSLNSSEHDRFIEVKTYKGEPHFHWSRNEKTKASILRDHYYIYLVDYDRIDQHEYIPQMIQDPIANVFESSDWSKTIDSYLIERIYPEELYQSNIDSEEE